MKTGPKGHWWVWSFMRMYNNLVPKIHSSLLVKRNIFKKNLTYLSFATKKNAYYLLISRFSDVIIKKDPRGHWWVCSFMRMYHDLVPRKLKSTLVESNLFIPFSNVLSFTTNIIAYYLLISRFKDVIVKTGPRGHWLACCFMRMYHNLVPKTQQSTG